MSIKEDNHFILRPPHTYPTLNPITMPLTDSPSADANIPIIDISNPSPEVAQQVLSAASTHGFLFIKNDGVTIPPSDIADMFALVMDFK